MIPLATTTIDVYRPRAGASQDPHGEGYDDDFDTVEQRKARAVRAVIRVSSSLADQSQPVQGGDSETIRYTLVCDPCDLGYRDHVIDAYDGTRYEVLWAKADPGIAGLAHIRAGLRTVTGMSAP